MNEKQADTLLNVPEIVKRAKIALNLKRDSELASYLGVARDTFQLVRAKQHRLSFTAE